MITSPVVGLLVDVGRLLVLIAAAAASRADRLAVNLAVQDHCKSVTDLSPAGCRRLDLGRLNVNPCRARAGCLAPVPEPALACSQ